MSDRTKVIESEMSAAIARKEAFAADIEARLTAHYGRVNEYATFWRGRAHTRFITRYSSERHHPVYLPEVVECLRDQAREMQQILDNKRANDRAEASRL
jgi:uncharacterized protein YukE